MTSHDPNDAAFVAMLAAQQTEQNRQRAAYIVSEFKLLPTDDQTAVPEHLNQFCLRGEGK